MRKNPWITKDTKEVFNNPWIRLYQSDVLNPSGEPGEYTVVHFKNLAVGCVPIDNEGNIVLVGQWRYPHNKYSWEIPLGGANPNLNSLEECKRELKEETGLEASYWKELLFADLSNATTDEKSIIYLCIGLTQGVSNPESCEKLEVKRVPFEEALRMVMSGDITDSLSMMAIMKLAILTNTVF